MRSLSKTRKDSCSVCFYVTALSLNRVETDVLEVLHFFGRKTPFHPILLFGFSTLKPFLLGLTKKQITVHNQSLPTFLSLFNGVPFHTTTQPLLILRGPSEVRKKGMHAYILNFRRISFVLEKPSYQKIKSNKAFSIQPLNHTPRKESVRQVFREICGLSMEVQKSFSVCIRLSTDHIVCIRFVILFYNSSFLLSHLSGL